MNLLSLWWFVGTFGLAFCLIGLDALRHQREQRSRQKEGGKR